MDIKSSTNQDQIDQSTVKQEPIPENSLPPENQPQPEVSAVLTETSQIEETQAEYQPSSPPPIETPIETLSESQPENNQTQAEKYQDLLDKYASTQTENPDPSIESPLPSKDPLPQPEEPRDTVPSLASFNPNPEIPQNNIFKISFIASLVVFIFTSTVLSFVYFKSKSVPTSSKSSIVVQITPTVTPTADVCTLNEKTYQIGESFAAADGCNTCTCSSNTSISCTDNDCLSTKSATSSATTTITPTKTIIPTKTTTPSSTSSSSKI